MIIDQILPELLKETKYAFIFWDGLLLIRENYVVRIGEDLPERRSEQQALILIPWKLAASRLVEEPRKNKWTTQPSNFYKKLLVLEQCTMHFVDFSQSIPKLPWKSTVSILKENGWNDIFRLQLSELHVSLSFPFHFCFSEDIVPTFFPINT